MIDTILSSSSAAAATRVENRGWYGRHLMDISVTNSSVFWHGVLGSVVETSCYKTHLSRPCVCTRVCVCVCVCLCQCVCVCVCVRALIEDVNSFTHNCCRCRCRWLRLLLQLLLQFSCCIFAAAIAT